MKTILIAFAFGFLHGVYAQNDSIRDAATSELGIAILGFVGVILGMVSLTWCCFCVCMCKVAQEARQEEKIELAREERDFERREMEMRFRHQRDGASRLMQHQRDIERSIMTDRHQSKSFISPPPIMEEEDLDSASVLHAQIQARARAPAQQQHRILSSFQSIPTVPYNSTSFQEELDHDDNSSIDSNDLVDIMNMPAQMPRPRH